MCLAPKTQHILGFEFANWLWIMQISISEDTKLLLLIDLRSPYGPLGLTPQIDLARCQQQITCASVKSNATFGLRMCRLTSCIWDTIEGKWYYIMRENNQALTISSDPQRGICMTHRKFKPTKNPSICSRNWPNLQSWPQIHTYVMAKTYSTRQSLPKSKWKRLQRSIRFFKKFWEKKIRTWPPF